MLQVIRFGMPCGARLVALIAVMLMLGSSEVVSEEMADTVEAKMNDELRQELQADLETLNAQIAQHEVKRDADSKKFFNRLLSEKLIFRRASGTTVGKVGFMDWSEEYPFKELKAEAINVKFVDAVDDRALVTLLITGITAKGEERRYWNIRLFFKADNEYGWQLEFWYNYPLAGV